MSAARCGCCGKDVEIGQTIVGMPVIRIVDANNSSMAGTEILFHVRCFLEKMGRPMQIEVVN